MQKKKEYIPDSLYSIKCNYNRPEYLRKKTYYCYIFHFTMSFLMPKKPKLTAIFYYAYVALLIVLICVTESLRMVLYEDYYYAKVVFLASLFFILLPAYLFRNNIKLYLIYLAIPFIFLFIKFACYFIYKVPFDETAILMIVNTNMRESREMISQYFLIIVVCLIIYSFSIYLVVRYRPAKIPSQVAKYISIVSLLGIFLLPLVCRYGKDKIVQGYPREVANSFPGSYLVLVKNIYIQHRLFSAYKSTRENFRFSASQDTSIHGKQVHVLIIGESCRYDHWGINGYFRNTSPLLNKQDNLIVFSNAAAGGYITEFAVPLMLTGTGAENDDQQYKQQGVLGVFNESGFQTYWISNQTDRGNITIHSSAAKHRISLLGLEWLVDIGKNDAQAATNKTPSDRDMVLVDSLKAILMQPGDKKFIVLHTLGSHYNYNARYPDSFDIYKPSYKTVTAAPTDRAFKNVLINTYDNTIVYTDAVIDSVIRMVSKLNTFSSVTYMADHGEDLLDDKRNLCYHGNPIPSKYVAHVPFFIWYSPSLKQKLPENIANLYKHKDSKTSSQNIIFTLSGMVGIHYPAQDSTQNIASPYFQPNKQLILGDKKVYEVAHLK